MSKLPRFETGSCEHCRLVSARPGTGACVGRCVLSGRRALFVSGIRWASELYSPRPSDAHGPARQRGAGRCRPCRHACLMYAPHVARTWNPMRCVQHLEADLKYVAIGALKWGGHGVAPCRRVGTSLIPRCQETTNERESWPRTRRFPPKSTLNWSNI